MVILKIQKSPIGKPLRFVSQAIKAWLRETYEEVVIIKIQNKKAKCKISIQNLKFNIVCYVRGYPETLGMLGLKS